MDLSAAQDLLQQWGYLIIIGWTFLEGETIVIVAGLLSQMQVINLNPWLIALCAFSGSFLSDQLMFCLGKYKGPDIFKRFPRLDKNTNKARRLLLKYETALILGFRFVYGVRNVTPILLGISGVKHAKFIALNFIGASVWALSFSFGGFYFGEALESLAGKYPNLKFGILIGLVAIVMAILIIKRIRKRSHVKNHMEVTGIDKKTIKNIKKNNCVAIRNPDNSEDDKLEAMDKTGVLAGLEQEQEQNSSGPALEKVTSEQQKNPSADIDKNINSTKQN